MYICVYIYKYITVRRGESHRLPTLTWPQLTTSPGLT